MMKATVVTDQADSSGAQRLAADLQEYSRQFAAIQRDAKLEHHCYCRLFHLRSEDFAALLRARDSAV
jgi:hypothetical protein